MTSAANDVSEKIIDGLSNYSTALQDFEAGRVGAELYGDVAHELGAVIHPADTCTLAFPTMLLSADKLPGCLFVVLQDRIVIAWQRGIFRSRTGVVVIPLASITSVTRGYGSTAATRDAVVLVIAGTPGATIALPKDRTDAADAAIRTAIGTNAH
jgi:hypothetical protein